jgi:hypothetical protein
VLSGAVFDTIGHRRGWLSSRIPSAVREKEWTGIRAFPVYKSLVVWYHG